MRETQYLTLRGNQNEKAHIRLPVIVALIVFIIAFSQADAVAQSEAMQFRITIDSAAHQTYGLFYPVTYVFQIPSGSSNLSGEYRYSETDAWTPLATMTAADVFNGISAARFDYEAGRAYLSVPFSPAYDSIYLHILQGWK